MKFEFTLSKEYLLDFHMNYYLKTKTFLGVKLAFTTMMLILWAFIYFVVATKYKLMIVIMFFIYVLLSLVFKKQLYTHLARTQILNSLDNYKNEFIFLPTIITMYDDTISIDTKFNTKFIEWTIIKDLHIVEKNIIIRGFGDQNIIFIPSECVKNKADLDMLINLFKKNSDVYPEYNYPTDIKI